MSRVLTSTEGKVHYANTILSKFTNDLRYFSFSIQTQKGIGPVCWMAPESIAYRVYSKKSDVWMFGILGTFFVMCFCINQFFV